MSEIPSDLYYTSDHEWVRRTGDDTVRVGITDYAQSALGDVVFTDLPAVGTAGALDVDGTSMTPPYSVLAIGDAPTLAAAMNIPGGAMDSIERVGGTMTVQQADAVNVTALRQPKPRQYAQPVK